jgi:F-type H+-transporting ATPase subunit delta
MRDKKVATRYARALLGALPDPASQDLADAFLSALADGMRSHGEVREFLSNPSTPASAKKGFLRELARARGVPPRVTAFLETVVDRGRASSLDAIADVFRAEREAAQGRVSGTLTTAAPVDAATVARAEAALQRLAGRKVSLTTHVDPALLGGAVARIGSMVYDGSLRTHLARLRRTMGEE